MQDGQGVDGAQRGMPNGGEANSTRRWCSGVIGSFRQEMADQQPVALSVAGRRNGQQGGRARGARADKRRRQAGRRGSAAFLVLQGGRPEETQRRQADAIERRQGLEGLQKHKVKVS